MTAFVVEGGLALLAIGVSVFGFFDQQQRLDGISRSDLITGVQWGLIGLIPMLGYLAWFHFYPTRLLQPMRDFVDEQMRPFFRDCSLLDLALISVLAGFCEELMFRWCLQGGIVSIVPATAFNIFLALLVASIVFGLCHWVNASYGISTAFVGAYLGMLMVFTGTFIAPAVTHTLYDFIALIYIARWNPGSEKQDPPDDLRSDEGNVNENETRHSAGSLQSDEPCESSSPDKSRSACDS